MTTLLDGSSSFLQVSKSTIKAWMSLNFCQIPSPVSELAALEHLKLMDNAVTTLAPSFLIGSSSFMQVTTSRTYIKALVSLNFKQNRP